MAEALSVDFELELPEFRLAPRFSLGPQLGVLFGPSGSGKTLTLKVLAGLLRPDRGQIRLNGRDLYSSERGLDTPPQARKIGYVPQHYALFPHRTVAENIGYGLHSVSSAERRRRVSELVRVMRLDGLEHRKPAELSSGQQQRAALARALARRPDLLLMDEPFGAVEEDLRSHLRAELVRVQRDFGISVLLVTHSLSEAYSLADWLIVLRRGAVMQQGTRDAIYRSPVTPEVARLVGMVNVLSAEITDRRPGELGLSWNGLPLKVTLARTDNPEASEGPSVLLGIRPEEISLLPDGEEPPGPNRLAGTVARDIPFGPDHLLEVEVSGTGLQVRVSHPALVARGLTVGQAVQLVLDPARFHIFPPAA